MDKDGNFRDIIFAPETKHVLEFMFKAAQGGYFDPGQMTIDDAAMAAAVKTGRVFCFIGNVANSGFRDERLGPIWVNPGPIQSNQGTKPIAARCFRAGFRLDANLHFQDGQASGTHCQMD